MSKLTKLTEIITKIVNEKGYRNCYGPEEVEEVLSTVNFYALFHELSNRMYPVYSFLADGDMPSTLKYRGAKLFPGNAVRVYRSIDYHAADEVMEMTHSMELWILEDMTLTVTSCFRTVFGDEEYYTEYREFKGTEWPDDEADFDIEDFCDYLTCMYPDGFDPDETIIHEP